MDRPGFTYQRQRVTGCPETMATHFTQLRIMISSGEREKDEPGNGLQCPLQTSPLVLNLTFACTGVPLGLFVTWACMDCIFSNVNFTIHVLIT